MTRRHAKHLTLLSLCAFAAAMVAVAACGGKGGGSGSTSPTPTPSTLPTNPMPIEAGIPLPKAGVYTDLGIAPPTDGFRALLSFPIRNPNTLQSTLTATYDPSSPTYHQYMTPTHFGSNFAPHQADIDIVVAWLTSNGMAVPRVASNRLLVEFTGTVGQFNTLFITQLHDFERVNAQAGNDPVIVYGRLNELTVPQFVADRATSLVIADLSADTTPLPVEGGAIVVATPANPANGLSPANVSKAYGAEPLYAAGANGTGVKVGVVVGATFKFKDLQSFWQSWGITRPDPTVVVTAEAPATRYLESTLDVEWSGALAPGSDLIVYEGADAKDTSLLWAFNEAVGAAQVDVLTDSFAHREDAEMPAVEAQYEASAQMGAAIGMTILSASGDSSSTDTPSSSPHVTAIGGTFVHLAGDGTISSETAWSSGGNGSAETFVRPDWQAPVLAMDSSGQRAVCDLSLNASPGTSYWVYYLGAWGSYGGTSFASPVFAGLMGSVDSKLVMDGKPVAGWLNPVLYNVAAVHGSFHDVTSGTSGDKTAGPGWDYPTGWGTPNAAALAAALP